MLEKVLYERFGYRTFREGQKEIIEHILNKEDVVAMLPTGMGKSLCYQLPAYIVDGPVLIVSPLLSLMQDQVDQLKKLGEKRVVAFNSFLPFDERKYALRYLEQYRFIFVSPEMLAQPTFQERFLKVPFSFVVVDEAHCISEWGFDFRPDYLRIKQFLEKMPHVPKLALTATATEQVIEDIETYLVMKNAVRCIHSVDRPNLKMVIQQFDEKQQKNEWLMQHISTTAGPGIVYIQSRNRADRLAKMLLEQGIQVASYHGGLENEDRQFIQQQFIIGQLDWVIATNAFGMGVHKADIRQVIHETMPSTVANYMQEIGRAGRDGEDSVAITLYAPRDEEVAHFIAIEDLPGDHQIDQFLQLNREKYDPHTHFIEHRITETMHRVLNYWLSIESVDQLKLRFHELRLIKRKQVNDLLTMLTSKTCIREQLLAFYGQQLNEKHLNCCSNCGLDFHMFIEERRVKEIEAPSLHWQNRLQSFLQ